MTIGERIKKIRIENNLKQADFANKIGKAQNTLSKIESEKANPTIDIIISICQSFNVSADYLLFGTNQKQDNEILNLYNHLTEEYKAVAKHEIKKLLKEQQEEQKQESKGYKKVGNL